MSRVSPSSTPKILRSEVFRPAPWLVHGFSTRSGGYSRPYGGHSLNMGFTAEDSRAAVERNRTLFVKGIRAGRTQPWQLVTLRQIHSDIVRLVQRRPEQPLAGDGLITETPGLLLGVLTADCIPVILVDQRRRALGVFHAGWRGSLKRIVQKGLGEMRRNFGSRARDLRAAIGPGIHGCCYQVGAEVREQFYSQFPFAAGLFHEMKYSDVVRDKYPLLFLTARAPGHSELPGGIFLDLVECNRRQLTEAGVPAKRIWTSPLCTSCRTDLLFSHRGEQGLTGRMMAVAGIISSRKSSAA